MTDPVDAHARHPKRLAKRAGVSGLRVSMVLAIVLVVVGCASTQEGGLADLENVEPTEALGPEEVVRIQMDAFRLNNQDNDGIRIAFRFASPTNKRVTGPLPRFARMMMQATYRPMLEAERVTVAVGEQNDVLSRVRVDVVTEGGESASYYFYLRKQAGGPCEGCWMTEAVEVIPPTQQRSV